MSAISPTGKMANFPESIRAVTARLESPSRADLNCPVPKLSLNVLNRDWGVSDRDYSARVAARRKEVESAIEAELAWLNGERDEPGWPPFERQQAHSRQRFGGRRGRREDDGDAKPELYGLKSKYFEPVMQELHPPKRGSSAQFGRRNHDSRKIHLGDVFIDCSCSLGAV
jgi:hypothetical protein